MNGSSDASDNRQHVYDVVGFNSQSQHNVPLTTITSCDASYTQPGHDVSRSTSVVELSWL